MHVELRALQVARTRCGLALLPEEPAGTPRCGKTNPRAADGLELARYRCPAGSAAILSAVPECQFRTEQRGRTGGATVVAKTVCEMTASEAGPIRLGERDHGTLASRARALFGRADARWFQLVFLASFLLFGALARDFALSFPQVVMCFAAGLATQALWQWGLHLPGRRSWGAYLSAIITCFGICILVRAQNLWAHPLLACAAMSSKYLLRAGPPACRSHILNPANFAAFAAWAWVDGCWLSPGQWGADNLTDLWFLALGGLVTQRIARWDVSVTFLVVWASLLAA